jgi:thiol:disulfide interchange protein
MNSVLAKTGKMKKLRYYNLLATLSGSFLCMFLVILPAKSGPGKPAYSTGSKNKETVWLTNYDDALKEAQSSHKLVVIDFFAIWCGPCKIMERETFSDAKVQRSLIGFVPLKLDVDKQPRLAAQYGVEAMPTTLVVDGNGKPLVGAVGYLDVDKFLAVLAKAKSVASESGTVK